MVEQLKAIPKKLLDWWNKFSSKQKTIIICISAGVVLAFSILTYQLTKPQYTRLVTCESQKEAAEITEILGAEGLKYKTSTDGLNIDIESKQEGEARLLLGANNIPTDTYDAIKKVVEGGFSTTESDKEKLMKVYLEQDMVATLQKNEAVKKAYVDLTIPPQDGTLLAQEKESFASVTLEIQGGMEITEDVATNLARYVATSMGNTSTDNVTIIDTTGNLLFDGQENTSGTGKASNQIEIKTKAESLVKKEVCSVLIGTTLFDNVEVTSNLDMDFSSKEATDRVYTLPDDSTLGLLNEERVFESETSGGTGGEPGTGSNDQDDTTYVLPDYANSSSTSSERESKYLQNEHVESKTIPPGTITYANSSVAVAATKFRIYNEKDVKSQGLLDGSSWDEFKLSNAEPVAIEVSDEIYTLVAKATGIPEANIQIIAQEKPKFIDAEGLAVSTWDIVQIVLIIVILGLLAFVVLRSMRGSRAETPEEELSVEALLQSSPSLELEDIELEEKSETRRLIEKFVDENPEAVANLLRNWLQEDWG